MTSSATMVSPSVLLISLCYAVGSISALPIASKNVDVAGRSSSDDNSLLAQVGSLEFPYDPSCAQANGFLFSAGDVSCMASPFKPIAYCDEHRTDLVACIRRGLGGTSSMKYLKVDSQQSRSQLASMAMSAEGGGWGVKVSASAEASRESKMSSQSTSYVLYGHKHLRNLEVANPHLLELTDDAKHLIEQGFDSFTRTYGTHMVGYITSGATYFGSYTLFSTTSSTDAVTKISASVDFAGGMFSASGSASFANQQSSMNTETKVDATVKCTGSTICTSAVPDTPAKMLEMSKTWHDDTELEGKPLKMAIYPFARATSFATAVRNATGKSWSPAQVDAMFGFGLPTKPMLTEWKLQQAEAESFRKAVFLALSTWQGVADPTDQISRADETSIDKRTDRTLGKFPSLCTCPSGRRYEVADYSELNTCRPDKADWEFEWWLKGGAVACSGGVVRWDVDSDKLCNTSRTTHPDSDKLSEATMGATCGVPEIRLQLLQLQTRVEAYYSQFLNTSLDHVLIVQRAWQTKRPEVFFYNGLALQELKDQLEAIARLMDSTLIMLEGLSMSQHCHVEATFTPTQLQAIPVDMDYDDDNEVDVEYRMRTPQACAVAVMAEAKKDPLKCSHQFFRFQAAVDDKEAVCECFPPSTKCTKERPAQPTPDKFNYLPADSCDAAERQSPHRYIYASQADANKACQARGCKGLATKEQLKEYPLCAVGWTAKTDSEPNGFRGWYMKDAYPIEGCGDQGYNDWQPPSGNGGAYCTECRVCGDGHVADRKNIPAIGDVTLTPDLSGKTETSTANSFIFRINPNNPTGDLSM